MLWETSWRKNRVLWGTLSGRHVRDIQTVGWIGLSRKRWAKRDRLAKPFPFKWGSQAQRWYVAFPKYWEWAACSPFIKFVWAIPSLVVFMLSCLPYCPMSILINSHQVPVWELYMCVLITHLNLIPVNQAYWLISERWPKTGTIIISEDFKAFTKLSYISTAFSSSHIAIALLEADVGIFCRSIFRRWCWRENRIAPETHSPRPHVAGRCCSYPKDSLWLSHVMTVSLGAGGHGLISSWYWDVTRLRQPKWFWATPGEQAVKCKAAEMQEGPWST